MTVLCGGSLSAGAVPRLATALSRGQGDTVHPQVVVTGNFGNHDNRTGSRRPKNQLQDYFTLETGVIL